MKQTVTSSEVDRACVAAVLARYLPLNVDKAEAWAEMLCTRTSIPVEGVPGSGAGYTGDEIRDAAIAHAGNLRIGDYPAFGSLLDELRKIRQRWVREQQQRAMVDHRRQLEAGAASSGGDRHDAARAAARETIAALVANMTGRRSGKA